MIGDTYKAKNSTESNVTINDAAMIRKYDLQGANENQNDTDDCSDAPNFSGQFLNLKWLQYPTWLAMLPRQWRSQPDIWSCKCKMTTQK